jgi:glycerol kinase
MLKSTYGTGCFLMQNTGSKIIRSSNKLLSTVAYRLNGKTTYATEGSIFIAGAAVQWLRDGLKLIDKAGETQALAESIPSTKGVFLVPAFTGLGAPHWDANARGAIVGLTRDTGIAEICRAALEAVCYQTRDLVDALVADGCEQPATIRVDGGMVANDWLAGFLADIIGANVERPVVTETTALGAAYLAGLQLGIYDSLEQIEAQWQCERTFEPTMLEADREALCADWRVAVQRVK